MKQESPSVMPKAEGGGGCQFCEFDFNDKLVQHIIKNKQRINESVLTEMLSHYQDPHYSAELQSKAQFKLYKAFMAELVQPRTQATSLCA